MSILLAENFRHFPKARTKSIVWYLAVTICGIANSVTEPWERRRQIYSNIEREKKETGSEGEGEIVYNISNNSEGGTEKSSWKRKRMGVMAESSFGQWDKETSKECEIERDDDTEQQSKREIHMERRGDVESRERCVEKRRRQTASSWPHRPNLLKRGTPARRRQWRCYPRTSSVHHHPHHNHAIEFTNIPN